MKLNDLMIRRYNTGFVVEMTMICPVRAQFTDASLTGQGHDRNLIRAVATAFRDVLRQRQELNTPREA